MDRFLRPHAKLLITSTSTVLSVTGIICYIGLIAGALFALSMVLSDDRLARRVLRVILLSPQEHQWLQAKVTESSKKLAIAPPKIGVVEDLRPNAFTIGYGRRATIVFSIGLLNLLSREEVVAVASHELAHVKNNDFFFKTISNALTTVSFFNPLAYISSSTAQREREMLADERAVELLEKPSALANALAKICKALQNLPKETMLANFSSNLLVSSSVLHRVGILSTHPRLDTRLRNISAPKTEPQALESTKHSFGSCPFHLFDYFRGSGKLSNGGFAGEFYGRVHCVTVHEGNADRFHGDWLPNGSR